MNNKTLEHLCMVVGAYFIGWQVIKYLYKILFYICTNRGALITICISLLILTLGFKNNDKIFRYLLITFTISMLVLLWNIGCGIYSVLIIGICCFIKGAINDI